MTISNKFLYEGEDYDFDEIKRRTLENGYLQVYNNEVIRVVDGCEVNMGRFANRLLTMKARRGNSSGVIFYGAGTTSGVGFAYPDPSSTWGELIPLACIKTKARMALEGLRL